MASSTNSFDAVLQQAGSLAPQLCRDSRDDDEAQILEALLSEMRRWCAKNVDPAAIDERGALGRPMLDSIAEQGWFGLTVPEQFGGAGLSLKAAMRAVTELARFNGSLGTCVGLHSGLALYSLINLASPALQQRYLPDVAAGKRIAAFAATEPNAGSDIASMRTTLSERDGTLRLDGSKCYVTNGGLCSVLTVVARSPGLGGARAGHTVVIVDPSWKGVTRQREEKKLGLKGSSTITIDFDDVEIPADHVVGELSKGMDHAHASLTWGRTFMAAGCLGAARAAIDEAREHTAQRVQFGRPLSNFPLVRDQMAAAIADLYTIESVVRQVCTLFEMHHDDIGTHSAIAKIVSSEFCWNIVDRCLQLMGGLGFIEEAGQARRMRDMRVTRIFEGANDVLRMHIASSTLAWKPDRLREWPRLTPMIAPELASAASVFDELMTLLGEELIAIRKAHGFKLFDRQVLQHSMADAMMAVYSMVPVLLRANASGTEQERAIALLACSRLEDNARAALSKVHAGESADRAAWVATILG